VRRKPKAKAVPCLPAATCEICGGPLPRTARQFCDDCLPDERRQFVKGFSSAGQMALANLRAEGRDPMGGEGGRRKIGEANARRRREEIEWDRMHEKPDPEVFTREVLPLLQGVSLTKMKAATGLSVTMCAQIKRGQVPHPRHWDGLRQLGSTAAESEHSTSSQRGVTQ
jgi:hypothetical protein